MMFLPCCKASASAEVEDIDPPPEDWPLEKLTGTIQLLKAAAIGDLAGVETALAGHAVINGVYVPELMSELESDPEIAEAQLKQQRTSDPNYVFTVADWSAIPLDATALIVASRAGHIAVVKRLLEAKDLACNKVTREPANYQRNGQTALHWACRQGAAAVVEALLSDSRVSVNPCTHVGFTPFGLAIQQGHLRCVELLLECPKLDLSFQDGTPGHSFYHGGILEGFGADMNLLRTIDCFDASQVEIAGGTENRVDVVRRCLKDARCRKWFSDPDAVAKKPDVLKGVFMAVMSDFSSAMLALILAESGADYNFALPDGTTALDLAVQRGMIHHVRELLQVNAQSSQISPVRRAQMTGDASTLKDLCAKGAQDSEDRSILPTLHLVALQGDGKDAVKRASEELRALKTAEAVRGLLDFGRLPALFYALELGNYNVARVLLAKGYGFSQKEVGVVINACQSATGETPGERSYRACHALIANGFLERKSSRPGAMAFVKPWCSSLVAGRYLDSEEHSVELFDEFRRLCKSKNDRFYNGVEKTVSAPVLKRAALIAADKPTDPVRQDNEGVIPQFKFFKDVANRVPLSMDHEAVVAQAYAYLGEALAEAFETDVQQMFPNKSHKVIVAAPKGFQRMQNKLLNPQEHGDPKMARPRSARNVDVLRGLVIVNDVKQLEAVFRILDAKYKVVRVKNTHDPASEGWRGGYRSILVNFMYEPGVTWAQLFGAKVSFDVSDTERLHQFKFTRLIEESIENTVAQLWLDYVFGDDLQCDSFRDTFGVQGLQIIASEHPNEPVKMIAELQLVLQPFYEGRAVSHLLFKVSRCDTGTMEMIRDFFQEYFQQEALSYSTRSAVQSIVMAAREGRGVPPRDFSRRLESKIPSVFKAS